MILRLASAVLEKAEKALRKNLTVVLAVNEKNSVVAFRLNGQKSKEDILTYLKEKGLQEVSLEPLSFTDCHLPIDKVYRKYWYAKGTGQTRGGQPMGKVDHLTLPQDRGPLRDQLNAACRAMKLARLSKVA